MDFRQPLSAVCGMHRHGSTFLAHRTLEGVDHRGRIGACHELAERTPVCGAHNLKEMAEQRIGFEDGPVLCNERKTDRSIVEKDRGRAGVLTVCHRNAGRCARREPPGRTSAGNGLYGNGEFVSVGTPKRLFMRFARLRLAAKTIKCGRSSLTSHHELRRRRVPTVRACEFVVRIVRANNGSVAIGDRPRRACTGGDLGDLLEVLCIGCRARAHSPENEARDKSEARDKHHARPACRDWRSKREPRGGERDEDAGDRGIAPQPWRNAGHEVLERGAKGGHCQSPGSGGRREIGSGILPDSGRVLRENRTVLPRISRAM